MPMGGGVDWKEEKKKPTEGGKVRRKRKLLLIKGTGSGELRFGIQQIEEREESSSHEGRGAENKDEFTWLQLQLFEKARPICLGGDDARIWVGEGLLRSEGKSPQDGRWREGGGRGGAHLGLGSRGGYYGFKRI